MSLENYDFKALIFLMTAILLCSGCRMKIHKDYAFTEPEFRLNTGAIHAKLRLGKDQMVSMWRTLITRT